MNPVIAAVAAALMLCVAPAAAAETGSAPEPSATDEQWAKPDASTTTDPQTIVSQSGDSAAMTVAYAVQEGDGLRIETQRVRTPDEAESTIEQVQQDPDLVAVDVDSTHHLAAADPSRNGQWALDALKAETAWTASNGAGVIVAVVDSGVSRHPDLAGEFVPGIDVVDGSDPRTDPNGHGTHVAGIIAMTTHNDIGGAGLAPGVAIMPVVVASDDGSVRASDSAKGIIWAVDHGANVINMSYSGSATSVEQKAIQYAQSKGVATVAAVGNEYRGADGGVYNPVQYPAAFPGVVGVGAVTRAMERSGFSEVGKQVDVAAPGGSGSFDSPNGIFSTFRRSDYVSLQGTSMASPYVAATLALTIARERAVGVQVDPVDVVLSTASDLGRAGRDDEFGFGLVNPVDALSLVDAIASSTASAPVVRTSEVSTRVVHKISVLVNPGYLRYRIPAKGKFVVGWQRVRGKSWSKLQDFPGVKQGRKWYQANTAGGLSIRLVAFRKGPVKKNEPVWLSPTFQTRAAQPEAS